MNAVNLDQPTYKIVETASVSCPAGDRLFDFWDRVRGGAIGPAFGRDFQIDDLDWDLLPNMSIVDVVAGDDDYFYRFWGTRNASVKRYEMTGRMVSDSPFVRTVAAGRAHFREVIAAKRPLGFIYEAANLPEDAPPQLTIRFPLSNDGTAVSGIMSYQDLDRRDDSWRDFYETLWATCPTDTRDARRLVSLR